MRGVDASAVRRSLGGGAPALRRTALLSFVVAPLAITPAAVATDGSLYRVGVGAITTHIAPDPHCSARQDGAVFGISCAAGDPARTGAKWQIDMRSPWRGTRVQRISFRALRWHGPPTSLAVQVLTDGRRVWGVAERDVPRQPGGAKRYAVTIRGTTASLRLQQTQTRRQPFRAYTILEPAIDVRDIAPPRAVLLSVPPDWVSGGAAAIAWYAADNLGDDGLAGQRVRVGTKLVYSGTPGAGAHRISADLAGLRDGTHGVRIEVDGDGTAAAAPQTGTLRLDRTPPTAAVRVLRLPRGRARLRVSVSDATSGMRKWRLTAPKRGAAPLLSGTRAGGAREIALSDHLAPGARTRFVLQAWDAAGNLAVAASPSVARPLGDAGLRSPPRLGAVSGGPAARATPGGTPAGAGARGSPPPTDNARLLLPRPGVTVRRPRATLRWRGLPRGTTMSNVQLFRLRGRGLVKVHSAFPRGRSYRLPARVIRREGIYVWRVWPYRKARGFTARPLAISWFRLTAATPPRSPR